MTTTAPHGVPIPAGFSADGDWEIRNEPRPFRLIWGPQQVIGGDAVEVRLSALQYHDGTIETDHDNGPAIHVNVRRDWGISPMANSDWAGFSVMTWLWWTSRTMSCTKKRTDTLAAATPVAAALSAQPMFHFAGSLDICRTKYQKTNPTKAAFPPAKTRLADPDCVTSFVLVMPIMTKGTDTSWPTVSTSPSAAEFSRPHSLLTAALTPPLTGGLSPSPGIGHPSLLFDTSGPPPAPLVAGPFFSPDS